MYVLQSRTLVQRAHRGGGVGGGSSVCPSHQLCLCLTCSRSLHEHTVKGSYLHLSALTHSCTFAAVFHLFPLSDDPRLPSLTSLRSPPRVLLYSSPPSFKCQWAVEQYPGGHGDRRPPPCGLFLLLSLVLLLLGSCTRTTHSAWLKFMHQSREPWEICIEEFQ